MRQVRLGAFHAPDADVLARRDQIEPTTVGEQPTRKSRTRDAQPCSGFVAPGDEEFDAGHEGLMTEGFFHHRQGYFQPSLGGGFARPLDMSIAERIKARLEQLGMTPNAATLKAGLPRGAVRDIIAGRSKFPRIDTVRRIAMALDVDSAWLLGNGEELPPRPDDPRSGLLPILYDNEADRWRPANELRGDTPLGWDYWTGAPGANHEGEWLERVHGSSMDRVTPDGSLLQVRPAPLDYQPRTNDAVVVQRSRADGAFLERSLKFVEVTSDAVELWAASHDAERWATPLLLGEHDGETTEIVGIAMSSRMPSIAPPVTRRQSLIRSMRSEDVPLDERPNHLGASAAERTKFVKRIQADSPELPLSRAARRDRK